ncbi:MAG: gliding motility-associated C-terminal domain-containing protein [Bacteroidia bacterium]|nr:gliding motility-associated C-terminal domain-containing protein [Bacteroidia bacterium]
MFRKSFILLFFSLLGLYCLGQDVTPPEPVTINFVTVDYNTGNVTIDWKPSTSIDVAGYYVYYKHYTIGTNYIWENLKLTGILAPATTYIHHFNDIPTPCLANSEAESYRVAAYDQVVPVPNVSQMCDPHTTMYMNINFEPCYARNRISWTPYLTWTSSVFQYEIYYKITPLPGIWTLLATVPGNQISYTHNNLIPDANYEYYIKAIDGSQTLTSTSNKKQVTSTMPHPPTVLNADYCTVNGVNRVDLSFTIDTTADVISYKLIRADSTQQNYDTIKVFPASSVVGNKIRYTDYFDVNTSFYYYKLVAVNTCNVDISFSNVASNIILNVTPKDDMTNSLIWNNYRTWRGGIKEYQIFRINDNDTTMIATIPYGDTTYSDNLQNYLYFYGNPTPIQNPYNLQPRLKGSFCYFLRAYEGDTNPYNIHGISTSNSVCAEQFTRIFVPNAFTPNDDGLNDVFFPYITFTDITDYSFIVYDRWGNIVFQTSDTRGSWNGHINGNKAASGVYVYVVRYKSADNTTNQKTGSFTLYY